MQGCGKDFDWGKEGISVDAKEVEHLSNVDVQVWENVIEHKYKNDPELKKKLNSIQTVTIEKDGVQIKRQVKKDPQDLDY